MSPRNIIKLSVFDNTDDEDREYTPLYIETNIVKKGLGEKIYYRFENFRKSRNYLSITYNTSYEGEIIDLEEIEILLLLSNINGDHTSDLFRFNINIYEHSINTYVSVKEMSVFRDEEINRLSKTVNIQDEKELECIRNISRIIFNSMSNYKEFPKEEYDALNHLINVFIKNINNTLKEMDMDIQILKEIPSEKEIKQIEMENKLRREI